MKSQELIRSAYYLQFKLFNFVQFQYPYYLKLRVLRQHSKIYFIRFIRYRDWMIHYFPKTLILYFRLFGVDYHGRSWFRRFICLKANFLFIFLYFLLTMINIFWKTPNFLIKIKIFLKEDWNFPWLSSIFLWSSFNFIRLMIVFLVLTWIFLK
jgi:hypothetical protein